MMIPCGAYEDRRRVVHQEGHNRCQRVRAVLMRVMMSPEDGYHVTIFAELSSHLHRMLPLTIPRGQNCFFVEVPQTVEDLSG